MTKNDSWREEAWEILLNKVWDNKSLNIESVEYTKSDLDEILSKYTKSGQGEIRIFNYNSNKLNALTKRGIVKIPLTRSTWKIIKAPPIIDFKRPTEGGIFTGIDDLTEGMIAGIKETMTLTSNPGETTLLAIANHIGIIADFYGLKQKGTLFTGGRQKAGIHLFVGKKDIDMSKAQIEIDGGFEWPDSVVIVEMKSSLVQKDFDINQALLPMIKWKKLLKNKNVYSLVILSETNKNGLEYWVYDFVQDTSESPIGMKIAKSKRYLIEIK